MRWILIFFVVVCAGCEQKKSPPTIEVQSHDTVEWSGLTIHYANNDMVGDVTVTLQTPEEVLAYKKQVEFLLEQLEDAERKMQVHSDVSEPSVQSE